MGTLFRPLHLLILGEALADERIDGGLDEGCCNPFPMAPPLFIVRDRALIVGDVGVELAGLSNEALHASIGGLDLGEIIGQDADPAQGLVGLAMPETPFDPINTVGKVGGFLRIVMFQPVGVLAEIVQAHAQVEPIQEMLAGAQPDDPVRAGRGADAKPAVAPTAR